jgi:hypothetical protein
MPVPFGRVLAAPVHDLSKSKMASRLLQKSQDGFQSQILLHTLVDSTLVHMYRAEELQTISQVQCINLRVGVRGWMCYPLCPCKQVCP